MLKLKIKCRRGGEIGQPAKAIALVIAGRHTRPANYAAVLEW